MKNKAKLLSLVPIIYFSVSGGPFGLEEVISAVGPLASLLLILLIPLCWTIPEALIVAELSSSFPVHGGYYRWVQIAMGRFWGFMEGWWSILYTVIDLTIYPVLFITYLKILFPLISPLHSYLIQLFVIWFCAVVNIFGIRTVGVLLIGFKVFILLSFLYFIVVCFVNVPFKFDLILNSNNNITYNNLLYGISLAFWNFIGWDNATTALHEVDDAKRNYPKALFITIPVVVFFYFLPLLASVSVDTNWHSWSFGQFSKIATQIHSPTLSVILAIGGMIMCLGIFNSLLLSSTRVFSAMSEDKLLPSYFSKLHSVHYTPYISIIFLSLLYSFLVFIDLHSLVVFDVFFYLIALLLEVISLIILRKKFGINNDSFIIPGKKAGLIVTVSMAFVTIILLLLLNLFGLFYSSQNVFVLFLLVFSGIPLYILYRNKR